MSINNDYTVRNENTDHKKTSFPSPLLMKEKNNSARKHNKTNPRNNTFKNTTKDNHVEKEVKSERKFEVVSKVDNNNLIEFNKKGNHTAHTKDRKSRIDKIVNELCDLDKAPLYQFIVDTGHANGLEVHQINANGTIDIFNKETSCFVTSLIARPKQIKRYFKQQEMTIPKDLVSLAYKHRQQGANNW